MLFIHQNKTHSIMLYWSILLHCVFHFYDSHFAVSVQLRPYIEFTLRGSFVSSSYYLFIYLLIIRDKRASRGEFNIWMELHRNGEVIIIKVEHTQVWSSSTLISLLSINLKIPVVQLVAVMESRWCGASDTFCATVVCRSVVSFTSSCHTYSYLERARTCKSHIQQ
jgi:hypothetical protein